MKYIQIFYNHVSFHFAGNHVKSQANDESLAKNDDLESRELFVHMRKKIRHYY